MGSINCTVESTTSTTGSAVSIIRRVGGKKRKKRKQVLVDIFLIFFISSWVLFVFFLGQVHTSLPVILYFPVWIVHSVIGGSIGGGSP